MVDLLTLPPDWDANGGDPIEMEVVNAAFAFIPTVLEAGSPAPWVVPMSDGGIQLEWHTQGAELEVAIAPNRSITGYWYCESEGKEDEFEIDNDLTLIKTYIGCIR